MKTYELKGEYTREELKPLTPTFRLGYDFDFRYDTPEQTSNLYFRQLENGKFRLDIISRRFKDVNGKRDMPSKLEVLVEATQ